MVRSIPATAETRQLRYGSGCFYDSAQGSGDHDEEGGRQMRRAHSDQRPRTRSAPRSGFVQLAVAADCGPPPAMLLARSASGPQPLNLKRWAATVDGEIDLGKSFTGWGDP
jgi:hypothetical protein